MNRKIILPWQSKVFKILVFLLALSGFAQMPIFKRYYIADLPGLGWLAQFYTTHLVHYITAIFFLFLVGYFVGRYLMQWRRDFRISISGWLRIFLFAVIIITGALRVIKNLPDVHFGPTTTMLLDWIHLFTVIMVGGLCLVVRMLRRSVYLKPQP